MSKLIVILVHGNANIVQVPTGFDGGPVFWAAIPKGRGEQTTRQQEQKPPAQDKPVCPFHRSVLPLGVPPEHPSLALLEFCHIDRFAAVAGDQRSQGLLVCRVRDEAVVGICKNGESS